MSHCDQLHLSFATKKPDLESTILIHIQMDLKIIFDASSWQVIVENCFQIWIERGISRHTCAHKISLKVVIHGRAHHSRHPLSNLIAEWCRGPMTNVAGDKCDHLVSKQETRSNSLEAGGSICQNCCQLNCPYPHSYCPKGHASWFDQEKCSAASLQNTKFPWNPQASDQTQIIWEGRWGWFLRFLTMSHLFHPALKPT